MQSAEQIKPLSSDKTTITVTVTVQNNTSSTVIDVGEYELVKETTGIDLIYQSIERLTLELQRGIQYKNCVQKIINRSKELDSCN